MNAALAAAQQRNPTHSSWPPASALSPRLRPDCRVRPARPARPPSSLLTASSWSPRRELFACRPAWAGDVPDRRRASSARAPRSATRNATTTRRHVVLDSASPSGRFARCGAPPPALVCSGASMLGGYPDPVGSALGALTRLLFRARPRPLTQAVISQARVHFAGRLPVPEVRTSRRRGGQRLPRGDRALFVQAICDARTLPWS